MCATKFLVMLCVFVLTCRAIDKFDPVQDDHRKSIKNDELKDEPPKAGVNQLAVKVIVTDKEKNLADATANMGPADILDELGDTTGDTQLVSATAGPQGSKAAESCADKESGEICGLAKQLCLIKDSKDSFRDLCTTQLLVGCAQSLGLCGKGPIATLDRSNVSSSSTHVANVSRPHERGNPACTPYACDQKYEYFDASQHLAERVAGLWSTDRYICIKKNGKKRRKYLKDVKDENQGAIIAKYFEQKRVKTLQFVEEAKQWNAPNKLNQALDANETTRNTGNLGTPLRPAPHPDGGYHFDLPGQNMNDEKCEASIRTGLQICTPCNRDCQFGFVVSDVSITLKKTKHDCRRWFVYADFFVRTLAAAWQSTSIIDVLPPLGKYYRQACAKKLGIEKKEIVKKDRNC